ncbi:hypothetical protein FH972_002908 [Carpinus fangiana]|uniref:Uncharacterized protein n=1 Tax=Carpinus fangiana TaxID=176857 RepID=A0A5N6QGU3_9ROSI|nr:hypothetical protein FH972_002908 [Carpinus fangiana]
MGVALLPLEGLVVDGQGPLGVAGPGVAKTTPGEIPRWLRPPPEGSKGGAPPQRATMRSSVVAMPPPGHAVGGRPPIGVVGHHT